MLMLVLVSALLLSRGEAQAPGDESSIAACQQSYPNTWRVLMDSWRYKDLLDAATAVWEARNVDGVGSTWGHGFSGLCERDIRGCGTFDGGTPNNWAFTQQISKDIPEGQPSNFPVKVYVNVTYSHSNCMTSSGCMLQYDIYNYLVDTPQSTAIQTDTSRYSLLQNIQTSGTQEVTRVLDFDLSPSNNGFYLAFRDTGTCVFISRVSVYRNRCPEKQTGLVLLPERPAHSSQTQSFEASCVPNASPTSSLTVSCTTEGEWVGTPQCQCNGGYINNGSTCEACPAGTFSMGSSCSSCPANTVTTEETASECSCLDGFYRAPGETASIACTSPPSAVTSPSVTGTTDTTATLRWGRPEETGRADFYYTIFHSDPDGPDFITFEDRHEDPNPTVTLTVTGLRPTTRYTFRIVTANGVSEMNPEGAPLRMVDTSGTTQEGFPGPPESAQSLCNVVVWQEPDRPNGVITGYEVLLKSSSRNKTESKSGRESFHIVNANSVSAGTVLFQVRVRTAAGFGEWSAPQDLGCINGSELGCDNLPGRVDRVMVSGSLVVWTRPPAQCLAEYNLRIIPDGQSEMIVELDASQHSFNISRDMYNLPATVEVRGENLNGFGDWSDPIAVNVTDTPGQVDVLITSISTAAPFVGGVLLTLLLVAMIACLCCVCRKSKEKNTAVHNRAFGEN